MVDRSRNNPNKLRVLVLCHDVIGINMAGPGIRFQNVARVLSKHFDVTLGVFDVKNRGDDSIAVVNPDGGYKSFFDKADVIFAQWLSRPMVDYANENGKLLVFDFYAPVPIEYLANLEFSKAKVDQRKKHEFDAIVGMYKEYLDYGSLFTCSNPRQKDFWAGFLTASGLINLDSFRRRKFSSSFLICPMGIENNPPKATKKVLRSKLGLQKNDFVLLWTGGIWDWFDAQLIIRAMKKMDDTAVKLVFLGTKHPNDTVYADEMSESLAARKLADELGLSNKSVFFLDGWVPYSQRAAYLTDADAAIYSDKLSLETRFSHRTRVLDHIWCELPTIASKGDYMSEIIEQEGLGLVVERTAKDFAQAIRKLHSDAKLYKQISQHLRAQKANFTWEVTLKPLVERLKLLEGDSLKMDVAHQAKIRQKTKRLPLKSRVKRSAEILLLGQ